MRASTGVQAISFRRLRKQEHKNEKSHNWCVADGNIVRRGILEPLGNVTGLLDGMPLALGPDGITIDTAHAVTMTGLTISNVVGTASTTFPFAKTGSGTVSLAPAKLVLTVGVGFQFSGVSLDLSGTTLELVDPDNLSEGFTVATSDTAITGKPAASNLPKGWRVKKSADGITLTIAKVKGVTVNLR